ncbi:MAG: hypothetical protein UHH87_04645, partial [Akkermansia sp.]|nr:hypothetical protein [Akkermansia sp.]
MKIHLISTVGLLFLSVAILCPLAIYIPHESWWPIGLILGVSALLSLAPSCRRSWECRDKLHRSLLHPAQQPLGTGSGELCRYWKTLPGDCMQGSEFQ